ncbi:MAG: PAN domain-containing protein [Hyphomicrobiaceae bacterium]
MHSFWATAALAALGAILVCAQPNPLRAETKPAAARKAFTREPNTDRSGNDFRVAKLLAGDTAAICERMCRLTPNCVAYTFVKRSETVPLPLCRLKDQAPFGHESSCCTSGALQK